MFVKSTMSRGHEYLRIVKSVRKNGKPTHDTIANLGRAGQLRLAGLSYAVASVWVRRAYRQLLKIEEPFRVMKSTLRTRPVFVWTPEHVKGHFVMCFLAFALERELEYRLNKRDIENSPEQIKSALRSVQSSELSIEDETFYLKGKHLPLASKIFALLKMKQPINLMEQKQWQRYLT